MKLRLPNTFVLLFLILAMIAVATWLVPGGQYGTVMVDGKPRIDPNSFQYVPSHPQGFIALMMAPIKGFVEAAQIIGFVLIVGGAFAVLQATDAIDTMIKTVAKAHTHSPFVRAMIIPVFVTMFSLGGATFGMSAEATPFILIFVPLALALGYDSIIGVSIPFVGSQVGFAAAFLNPFNVGVAQAIAGIDLFSRMGYRMIVWFIATAITIGFLMWYAARGSRQARPDAQPYLCAGPGEAQGKRGQLSRFCRHDAQPRGSTADFRRLHGCDGDRWPCSTGTSMKSPRCFW